jgi:hypothetical protein
MAVEYEERADKEFKQTGDSKKGKSADGRAIHERHHVYLIPIDPRQDKETLLVTYVSPHSYLIRIIDQKQTMRTMTLPTRMVFGSEDVAEFMRKELIAYYVAPKTRY